MTDVPEDPSSKPRLSRSTRAPVISKRWSAVATIPKNQFNRALAKTRQPGSSFKPIVYMVALQGGMTPVTQVKSEPTVFTYDEGRQPYTPRNFNDQYANGILICGRRFRSRTTSMR